MYRLEAEARLAPGLVNLRALADEHPNDLPALVAQMKMSGVGAAIGPGEMSGDCHILTGVLMLRLLIPSHCMRNFTACNLMWHLDNAASELGA